jgi:hypothetical protein
MYQHSPKPRCGRSCLWWHLNVRFWPKADSTKSRERCSIIAGSSIRSVIGAQTCATGRPPSIECLKHAPRARYARPREHAVISAALEQLPAVHLARLAYLDHTDTIALTHLVADRPELVEALKEAYLKGFGRLLCSAGHFRLEGMVMAPCEE